MGGKIDLFPTDVLGKIAGGGPAPAISNMVRVPGWRGGRDVDLGSPFDFAPPPRTADVEAQRRAWLGPTYAALAVQGHLDPTFEDQVAAHGALSLVPAALLASVAKPAVDALYRLLDRLIPEAIRRPLERNLGLLIDQALAVAAATVSPLIVVVDGGALPRRAQIDVQAHSQSELSCGETAVATMLQSTGGAIGSTGVDTQSAWAIGGSGLVDEELARRGLSMITGPGDLDRLKMFLAHDYPVMVSIAWASGAGHYAVVTGYDDDAQTVTVANWKARGDTTKMPLKDFLADWGRHMSYMTVVSPMRDTRLDALRAAGDVRRADQIYAGLSLSDFYVTPDAKVFVEGAYRYVTHDTDITVRVNFDQQQTDLERRLGGSLAVEQQLGGGWYLGLTIAKLSVRHATDDWSHWSTLPLQLGAAVGARGFELRAATEDGGFQAGLTADVSRLLAGLGLNVNYERAADKSWRLYATLTGTI